MNPNHCKNHRNGRWRLLVVGAFGVLMLVGCAANDTFSSGQQLMAQGRLEEGLQVLQRAVDEQPQNQEYRAYYYRQRDLAVNQLLLRGDQARAAGDLDFAEAQYKRALGLDPVNVRAQASLDRVQMDRRHRLLIGEADAFLKAGNREGASARLRIVLTENPAHREARAMQRSLDEQRVRASLAPPVLKSALNKPVSLEFRDANLRSIFEVISRMAGVNFVFDKDTRPDLRATLFVKNTSIEDVINTLLLTNQLEKKIVNANTIIIYPNTPAKAREYQELVVKSFYLTNADVKQTINLIRTIIKTRDLYIDERLGLLVMRDTPDNVRLAEKLVSNHDLAEPEVVLEVEVAEVKRSRLSELGVQWPNQFTLLNINTASTTTVTQGTVLSSAPTVVNLPLTLRNLVHANMGQIGISPAPAINLRSESGDANLLANPRIRVRNR